MCSYAAVFGSDLLRQTHLSCGGPSLVEDQAFHIVSEVDEHDFGLGTLDTDGADEQAHVRFFLGKDMFDPRAYFGFDPVGGA